MVRTLLRSLIRRPPPRIGHAFRPEVEALEPRRTPTVSFDVTQDVTPGPNAQSVAVADFNGDGKPDLAFADWGLKFFVDSNVRVQLNTTPAGESAASFAPAQTFAVGAGHTIGIGPWPVILAVGDFNGDGKPDLAVANVRDGTVSILLNTTPTGAGTPSFAAQQTIAVGTNPEALAVGDFNGDGKPDLAVANTGSNTVSMLLDTTVSGSSTVTFTAQKTFAVGTSPASVAVADINADGKPDLAVANFGDKTISILLDTTPNGSSTASFTAQKTFAVGGDPVSVASADVNGDGKPDLAVANQLDETVSVLLNTTVSEALTPSFSAQKTFALGFGPTSLAVADLDGDGRPDLVTADNGDNAVSVLLNTTPVGAPSASFAPKELFPVGTNPVAVAVADLDGDGRPDLAVTNATDKSVSVLVNTTPDGDPLPFFAAQQTFAVGTGPISVVAADFNADGRPDLAVVNQADQSVSVLANTTAPFASAVPTLVGQFGGAGVWEFNRFINAWVQLTAANATLLATDPRGDVVGEFPGHGVWLYRPSSGWAQINGVDATALAMDADGFVAAEFPGFGVGEYLPVYHAWRSLTGANASLLVMDALGDVAGEFPGHGVWLFRSTSGWAQINGTEATLLAMDALGDVAANFAGVGVGEYRPASGWQLLNGTQAQALAMDPQGDVAAQFQGFGVGEFLPASGWSTLTASNAARLSAGGDDAIVGEFPGYGVWEYDPYRGWYQLTAADATVLALA